MLLFNQLNRTMAHPYFLNFTSVVTYDKVPQSVNNNNIRFMAFFPRESCEPIPERLDNSGFLPRDAYA